MHLIDDEGVWAIPKDRLLAGLAALAAVVRHASDTGVRHRLEDVAAELGIDLDEEKEEQ